MSYRFAVIGCRHGHIQEFIRTMLERGHTCAGIYDPAEWKMARQYAEKYNVPLVEDLDQLLEGVDIVGSAAINNEKIDWIEACEKRGIHISLDKPAVTNRDGLERLEAVIQRNNIQVGLMLPKRFWGGLVALKQAIEAGTLGTIAHIYVTSPHKLMPASRDPWHFSKEQNGGVLVDILIHDMDLIRWLTGQEIEQMQSVLTKNMMPEYPDFYDATGVQVVMSEGTTAQLYADWHTPANNTDGRFSTVVVAGTEGYANWGVIHNPHTGETKSTLRITRSDGADRLGEFVANADVQATALTDFLARIEGKPYQFSHADILAACRATIEADEQAIIRNRYA